MKSKNRVPRIPIRTRVGLDLFGIQRAVQAKLHDLRFLFWECTLRCNLACLHCGSDCSSDDSVPDMPIGDLLPVLDRVAAAYDPNKIMIAVTGGEPLVRKDLELCGHEFYARGFPWGIVTNGFILDSRRLNALLSSGLRSVTVSLDGLPSSHDWLRGRKGSFERAIRAINLCGRSAGMEFDVVTCVHRRNIDELPEIEKILVDAGVKQWRLFTVFPKGRAEGVPEFRLTRGEFRYLLGYIAESRVERRISTSYGCEGFLGSYEGRVRDSFFFCRAGINVGSVLVDGSISACLNLRGDYIQGSIYTDDFVGCWENRYGIMRDRGWTKTGKCLDCSVYRWCNGNGLHLRDEKTGELLFCHYENIVY